MKKIPDSDITPQMDEKAAPLDEVLSRPTKIGTAGRAAVSHISGVVIGKIADCSKAGEILVEYPGNPGATPQSAVVATAISEQDIDKDVALSFVGGDPLCPIVLGLIEHPEKKVDEAARQEGVQVKLDGETLTFSAEKEIVLRCGEASITLTKAGKVLIKGTYTSSQSTGVNRIKGGSVQVN